MIEVYIQRDPEACPHPELWQETRLAAVDVALEGFDSNEYDDGRGSDVGAGELGKLISITGTSGTIGSKVGRSGDIGSNSGRELYTSKGSGSSTSSNSGISSYFDKVGGG